MIPHKGCHLAPSYWPTRRDYRELATNAVWGWMPGIVRCSMTTKLAAGGLDTPEPIRAEEQLGRLRWTARVEMFLERDERVW